MANLTTAKVTIIAHKVGPQLKRYIDDSTQYSYDILSDYGSGYGLEKRDETWTFEGYGTGRWNYGNNVDGYFGGKDGWFGPDSECLVSYRELAEAIVSTRGSLAIEWTDYDPGEWIGQGDAYLGTDEVGNLSFSGVDLNERWTYSLANLMTALDLTLEDAIIEHAGDEGARSFWDFWELLRADEAPSPEEAFRLLEALRELEFADENDELSEEAALVLQAQVLLTVPAATVRSAPAGGVEAINDERQGE